MQDLRLAFRTLLKHPGFTAVAIITLALGIGANTAVFTVINAVLLAPLPYESPERMVVLNERTPEYPYLSVTRYNYDDWRARARSFSGIAAVRSTSMTVTGAGEPERVPVKMLTATLLPLLGVRVEDGRGFVEADDKPGAEGVAIVSAGFAKRKFLTAPAVGQRIVLDNTPYAVVGVLPARFELFQPADVYVPFGPWAATLPEDRGWHPGILPIARLKDGVSLEDARVEMEAIAQALETQYPESNSNVRVQVTPVQDLIVQNVRPALRMLQGAVVLVLLIACANVANLLLVRAAGRQKEIAVRIALGAGRLRIVRQLLVESVVLACAGGAAGLLLATWGVSFLAASAATALPRAYNIAIATPVTLFALALSIVTGIVFGLAPALQAAGFDVRRSLNEEGRGTAGSERHRRLRGVLVVGEVGLALVLLVSAGLLMRSFSTLTRVSPGFDPENLLVVNLPLSPQTYGDDAVRAAAVERILSRVKAVPGVRNAGLTTMLPMAGEGPTIHFNRMGYPPEGPDGYIMAGLRAVTPEYLQTLGVQLTRGRLLEERDRDWSPRVVVINEAMAQQFFPDIDPIGQHIQFGTIPVSDYPTMAIVGIVSDVRQSFAAAPKAEMFVPYFQAPDPMLAGMYLNMALVVRTSGDPVSVVPPLRSIVRDVDAAQPLVNIRTMETAIAGTVAQPRLHTILLVVFAAVAVLLAAVGVYGVMAYTVTQRIPEIGVRMAIGASPGQVIRMVVWQGAQLALVGLGLGLVAAVFAARAVKSLLFDVSGLDPLTFAVAPVVLALAALLASYIPARRAAHTSPLAALGRGV
jgi:putative ABC transport system permease protein